MPTQDRRWGDREDFRPPAAGDQSLQRRKPEPVGAIPLRPVIGLAAEHLVSVTEHQQLIVIGQISADQHVSRPNKHPHQPMDKRQQHFTMVAAAALIMQQNPSSQHETVFPSGTPGR